MHQDIDEKSTVRNLKEKIEDKEGIPIPKQTIKKGKQTIEGNFWYCISISTISDEKTLEESWVTNDTTLLLLIEGEFADYFDKPKDEENPTHISTKSAVKPTGSETILLSDTQEGINKENEKKPWWEQGGHMSGTLSEFSLIFFWNF